jgi:hypothetical protein
MGNVHPPACFRILKLALEESTDFMREFANISRLGYFGWYYYFG